MPVGVGGEPDENFFPARGAQAADDADTVRKTALIRLYKSAFAFLRIGAGRRAHAAGQDAVYTALVAAIAADELCQHGVTVQCAVQGTMRQKQILPAVVADQKTEAALVPLDRAADQAQLLRRDISAALVAHEHTLFLRTFEKAGDLVLFAARADAE